MSPRPADRAPAALPALSDPPGRLLRRIIDQGADLDDLLLHRELLGRLIRDYQAVAVERDRSLRKIEADLALARVIQRQLLPREIPRWPGLEVAALYEPSSSVGGDLYDFFEHPEGPGIMVGDVSGHGVASALLFALFQAAARRRLAEPGALTDRFAALNLELVGAFPDGRYVSAFFARFAPDARALTWLKAGQEPGYLVRATGEVRVLEGGGPPLGAIDPAFMGAPEYIPETISLAPGDRLFLATDGLVEAADPAGRQFGQQRLVELLGRLVAGSAATMVESVRQEVRQFAAAQALADDFTAVAVAVTGKT